MHITIKGLSKIRDRYSTAKGELDDEDWNVQAWSMYKKGDSIQVW